MVRKIQEYVADERRVLTEVISSGGAKDYTEYREMVKVLETYDKLLAHIKTLAKRADDDDSED